MQYELVDAVLDRGIPKRMRIHEPIAIRFATGDYVRGDLRYCDAPADRAIVFIHGFASHRQGEKSVALEEACARQGWTFVAFDCRGHGESDGSMRDVRPSRLLEDLGAVCDHLIGRGVRNLGLVGSSMGGFLSAWYGQQCAEVFACVLIAPAFRFLERRWEALSDFERAMWKKAGYVRYKNEYIDVDVSFGLMEERHLFPFEDLIARWTKPALIFHGVEDDTVPVEDSIDFLKRASARQIELRLIKNGDHRLTAIKDEMAAEACRFFGACLKTN